jgi:hypothetical protein
MKFDALPLTSAAHQEANTDNEVESESCVSLPITGNETSYIRQYQSEDRDIHRVLAPPALAEKDKYGCVPSFTQSSRYGTMVLASDP